ncbi:MAG: 3-oxoacyl-[acyl-carrier-protein] reductase [Ktedonobacteraceae bacterium]
MKEASVIDQVAIVTGAGQGIGRAIALRLARDGMHVAVADIRADLAESVAAEISALGRKALPLKIDVTSAADRQRLFAATLAEFKRFDALVNNAAIQRIALPLDVTEEHWDLMMNVNAKAVYFCCQLALKHMRQQQSGRIVNLASIAGKTASTVYHPIYNITKASVIALTKTFAYAMASERIRVNCVCPGVIETAMQDQVDLEISRVTGQSPAEVHTERASRIPLGYLGDADDVAAVISFLIGPDSSYMTGQAINVSGGLVTY